MKMHTPNSRGMSVKRVNTTSAIGIPHFQRTVRTSADYRAAGHLRRPHASSVSHQRPQTLQHPTNMSRFQLSHQESNYLSRRRRPNFQSIVVRTADYPVAAKLKTRYHMVVVSFEHFRWPNRLATPIHFDRLLSHIRSLKRITLCL